MKTKIIFLITCLLSLEVLASVQQTAKVNQAGAQSTSTDPVTGVVTTITKDNDGNTTTTIRQTNGDTESTIVDSKGKIFATSKSSYKSTGLLPGNYGTSATNNAQNPAKDLRLEYEKVVQEYKDYLAKVPADTRQEIVAYRKEISKINQQKMELFQKLSQRAQEYLMKERAFKERLPAMSMEMNAKVDLNMSTTFGGK